MFESPKHSPEASRDRSDSFSTVTEGDGDRASAPSLGADPPATSPSMAARDPAGFHSNGAGDSASVHSNGNGNPASFHANGTDDPAGFHAIGTGDPAGFHSNGGSAPVTVGSIGTLGTPLDSALDGSLAAVQTWRRRVLEHPNANGSSTPRWLLRVPDIGPACEVLLADRLFFDLNADEREGLLAWIRGSQDPSGAWLDAHGQPDLSLTALGWWARVHAGDDRGDESMVRAARVVQALGGAQRANFMVRLWLALSGQIPWTFLPSVPAELFLLPASVPFSPVHLSPWARGILTPYLVLARAPARLQLADASELLLRRNDRAIVAPRLTRYGLAGDVLQTFDRMVKVSRKFRPGPLPRWGTARALDAIVGAQQAHGGWFGIRPTILSLLALRVMGATSDDPRIRRGLDYLRRARGLIESPDSRPIVGQGLFASGLAPTAELIGAEPTSAQLSWLLRQELTDSGPWQTKADCAAGGWPLEASANYHLDLQATLSVLDSIAYISPSSPYANAVWGAIRRATEVILAMQEPSGAFARFERGETRVPMQSFPWVDADLLAMGQPNDEPHVHLCARALHQLGRVGFRCEDDRIARGLVWLDRAFDGDRGASSIETVSAIARCAGRLLPATHRLHQSSEQRLRSGQREDGSFGTVVQTASALRGLLALGPACVQVDRAARFLIDTVLRGRLQQTTVVLDGVGLSPFASDPSAGVREVYTALKDLAARTSSRA